MNFHAQELVGLDEQLVRVLRLDEDMKLRLRRLEHVGGASLRYRGHPAESNEGLCACGARTQPVGASHRQDRSVNEEEKRHNEEQQDELTQ